MVTGEAERITHAAALISVGNVTSRVLGLARDVVKSYYFGAGGAVSAFDVAAQVPTMLYDLLTGGMLSSSLVPVFSDYAPPQRRSELWQLLSLLLSLLALCLSALVLIIEIAAPAVARLLSGGLPPAYLDLATQMIRITTPAIIFLNLSGLLTAALYALQRFNRPAFLGTLSNAVMVLTVILLGRTRLESRSLALGLLVSSIAQVLFQWPALRDAALRPVNPLRGHPALPMIGRLYLPIGLGLIVDQAAVALSFNLASHIAVSGIAWMKYAATIIQFPLGMVVTAVSVAILPTLSRFAAGADEQRFSATLAQGIRLVFVLVLPVTALLLVLAEPVVALLFQRGNFMPADTVAVGNALRYNLPGLIFAALDQPLIFAFYARKNTWTPALVGVGTTAFFTVLVLALAQLGELTLGNLILANSLKLTLHALCMFYLFNRHVSTQLIAEVKRTTGIAALAALAILPLAAGLATLVGRFGPEGFMGALSQLIFAGGLSLILYLWLLRRAGVEELQLLEQVIARYGGRHNSSPPQAHPPAEAPTEETDV
ncbi:MAG TPA: murein biosynthesis integral membrane protein MurJ [Anaerolineae bacterium]|nr:murein biosynthesis integral membrane protein MurJ [Anaerolineae bacterium]HXK42465.1 murein biosynthesis integral membrane protein MurJ [Anaerolineae bacterium]